MAVATKTCKGSVVVDIKTVGGTLEVVDEDNMRTKSPV